MSLSATLRERAALRGPLGSARADDSGSDYFGLLYRKEDGETLMAPHAVDTTIRVWVNYTCGLLPHSLQLRYANSTPQTDVSSSVDAIILTMLDLMDPVDSVLGADWSQVGTSIRFPFPCLVGSGSAVSAANNADARSSKLSITGKGPTGRLVAYSLFFLNAAFFTQGRYAIGVVAADVAAFWSELQNASAAAPCDINGDETVLKSYINAQENQYWVRKQR